MTHTEVRQAFDENASVMTSLRQECNTGTQSCPLHLMMETPWGPVRFTMTCTVLSGGSDVVLIGQKMLKEGLGIDVMAQLKASVLKTCGRQEGAGVKLTAGAVGEPNAGAVLWVVIFVTAFGPGGDSLGGVDSIVTLMLPSQRSIIFLQFEVEMRDRVGVSGTAVDEAFDHGFPPKCAKRYEISLFANILTIFVGNFRWTHRHAWSLWRYGVGQLHGWCAGEAPTRT